jgi:hypothetical protein
VCALLALFFGWHGWRHQEWTDGMMALACFGLGVYMLVDGLRQQRQRPKAGDSLKACLETSLQQVNHQIWLLKNILWTYLLPLDIPLVIAILVQSARFRHTGLDAVVGTVFVVGFCALVSWGVWWLNQYAVRNNLEPRRRELEALLAGLES